MCVAGCSQGVVGCPLVSVNDAPRENPAVYQKEQESVCFRIPLRNRKSLACFSVPVMEWISLCREEVIVKLMRSAEYFPYLYHTVADRHIDSWRLALNAACFFWDI